MAYKSITKRWLFNNLDNMSPELRLTLKHYLDNA